MDNNYQHYIEPLIATAKRAGTKILAIYNENKKPKFRLKEDRSPITEADLISNEAIKQDLTNIAPEIPILSEEEADIPFTTRQTWHRYWLVDPLDGTKEFIDHTGQFTVNIALIEDHRPVIGITYVPILNTCYYAWHKGGAFKMNKDRTVIPLKTHQITDPQAAIKIVISRQLGPIGLEPFLNKIPNHKLEYYGGSVKLCMIAEGRYDLYPRLGANCEWDTASGQCVLQEAGGTVVDFNFIPLSYNGKESFYNPRFIAIGDPNHWQNLLD